MGHITRMQRQIKRKVRVKRRKQAQRKEDMKKVNQYLEELSLAQNSTFVKDYESLMRGDIKISDVPDETGFYIEAKDVKIKSGPLPKDPKLVDMLSFLKKYCRFVEKQLPSTYCADRCLVNYICENLSAGNFKFDFAKVPEAFYAFRTDYK
jgi:hypothetical protein